MKIGYIENIRNQTIVCQHIGNFYYTMNIEKDACQRYIGMSHVRFKNESCKDKLMIAQKN